VLNDATGTINNAHGLYTYLSNGATGKISSAYGLYLAPPLNGGGGTFSNYTGVYIANPTAAVPNAFAVYSGGRDELLQRQRGHRDHNPRCQTGGRWDGEL